MERSMIFRVLKHLFGKVTKELVMSVINGALQHAQPDHRPPMPTRSQKRSKAGLVAWLDANAFIVTTYLQSWPRIH
jgi:hypothetical protein